MPFFLYFIILSLSTGLQKLHVLKVSYLSPLFFLLLAFHGLPSFHIMYFLKEKSCNSCLTQYNNASQYILWHFSCPISLLLKLCPLKPCFGLLSIKKLIEIQIISLYTMIKNKIIGSGEMVLWVIEYLPFIHLIGVQSPISLCGPPSTTRINS